MGENAPARGSTEEGEQVREGMRNYFEPHTVGKIEWLSEQSLIWTIENFPELALPTEVDDMFISPEFTQEPHPYRWSLILYPRGERKSRPGRVSLYLMNMALFDVEVSSSSGIVDIECNIVALNFHDRAEYRRAQTGANTRSQGTWSRLERFLSREKGYIRDNSLMVYFTIIQPMFYNFDENVPNGQAQPGPSNANR